ncbi:MAG: hypothetical protein MZW92_41685 [Comamonadaceae bacterium]|nr:hypothetical protein [Comamonadaceae bacterium]
MATAFRPQQEERLYNPTLALYFLKHLARHGEYPARLLDDNLAMDRNRIQYVARLPHGEALVNGALNPDRTPDGRATGQPLRGAGHAGCPQGPGLSRLAAVLLRRPHPGRAGRARASSHLTIPNQVIRKLYVERLQEQPAAGLRRPGTAATGGRAVLQHRRPGAAGRLPRTALFQGLRQP